MNADFLRFFRATWLDLHEPDVIWQLAALVLCLGIATLVARRVREQAAPASENRALQLGSGGIRRLAFPVVALLLVFFARALIRPVAHVNLLNLAVPLLLSLAAVRITIYLLRHVFGASSWLAASEKLVATLVWGGFALYLTGLSAPLIEALESVRFPVGKTTLDLWMILHGIAMILATVLGALWIAGLAERRLERQTGLDSSVRVMLARIVKAVLALLAVLFSMSAVGIDITALSVFGGALGVGLGLGLQKIASNYVSGFIILLERSIRIGNVIAIDANNSGVVTQITTRYTVVQAATGTEILVPNELLVGSVVQNQSYTDTRVRLMTTVQVAYDTDLPAAMELLQRIAAGHPRVLAEPPPTALVTAFADSGINLELGFWVADPEKGSSNVRSDVNLGIWREFRAAGIEIPYPQREVRLSGPAAASLRLAPVGATDVANGDTGANCDKPA